MSKLICLSGPAAVHLAAAPMRPRRRRIATPQSRLKAGLAAVVVGLMLASPVVALVAAVGSVERGVFHQPSPWALGMRR